MVFGRFVFSFRYFKCLAKQTYKPTKSPTWFLPVLLPILKLCPRVHAFGEGLFDTEITGCLFDFQVFFIVQICLLLPIATDNWTDDLSKWALSRRTLKLNSDDSDQSRNTFKGEMCRGLLVMIALYHEHYKTDKSHFQNGRRVKQISREERGFCDSFSLSLFFFFPIVFQLLVPYPSLASAEILPFTFLRSICVSVKSPSLFKLAAKQFLWKHGPIRTFDVFFT